MNEMRTGRGFPLVAFNDDYDNPCHLQLSSIATRACVWLSLDKVEPKIMHREVSDDPTAVGWVRYPIPDNVLNSGAMHLNQQNVKDLLPYLIRFAETGELFEDDEPLPFTKENGDC